MTEVLPFIPGQFYNRRADIHAHYKGNWQSGIAPSSTHPFIFIFTGKSGHRHGYEDGWDNKDVFTYTGEGQSGDMIFKKGNLALKDHVRNGKRVFLFESQKKGLVKFVAELEVFNFDYFLTKDTTGNIRVGIKFFFKRAGVNLYIPPPLLIQPSLVEEALVEYETKLPTVTERKGLVTSRVGQGAYRKRIIHRWEYQCAVTQFDNLNVLIASHIKPWSDSSDEQRLDVDNGLLLSPTYDALFDKHFISFENSGKIILSDSIEKQAFQKLGVTGSESIRNLSEYNFKYLDHHRANFQ